MNAKRCEICETRPIMTPGRMLQVHGVKFPYCEPCLLKAEWENTHSDYGHEGINEYPAAKLHGTPIQSLRSIARSVGVELTKEQRTASAIRDAIEAARLAATDGCWICHPELDETTGETSERNGSARTGMVIHVTLRADGKTKAQEISAKLPDGYTASISVRKGIVTLQATGDDKVATLRWDAQGHFLYGVSTVKTAGRERKVRNASEALRVVA